MNTTKKNSNLLCIIAIVVFLLVLGVAFIMIIKSEKWAPPLVDQGFLGLADPGQMLRCNGVQLGAMETKGCGECSRAAEVCLRHPLHGDKCRHALDKCADSKCELRSMMNRCSIGRSPDYSRGGTPQAQCPSSSAYENYEKGPANLCPVGCTLPQGTQMLVAGGVVENENYEKVPQQISQSAKESASTPIANNCCPAGSMCAGRSGVCSACCNWRSSPDPGPDVCDICIKNFCNPSKKTHMWPAGSRYYRQTDLRERS